jgi:hypothetical protein
MFPVDDYIRAQLDKYLGQLETSLDADGMAIISPIIPGLDSLVRRAIEQFSSPRPRIAIILDTPGGVTEVVERIVESIRHFYKDMTVVVPDRAMSAGTIFALSADHIMMDYFSVLGPIDPQIERDGKLVPALSYLNEFERLNEKASAGQLTTAEYALLNKLDLGELFQFKQASELSNELLIKWLTNYKFKDWSKTETRGIPVTEEMKCARAEKIANDLNNTERWHSHGRGIDLNTLRGELQLKIEDYSTNDELKDMIRGYFELLRDYLNRQQLHTFVHTREHF